MTPHCPSNRRNLNPPTSETSTLASPPDPACFAQLAVGCTNPALFFFPSYLSSLHTILPVHNFPQAIPFIKLSSINHDPHLHLSGFSPLRKILTVNHYPHNQDFQHPVNALLFEFGCIFFVGCFPKG